MLELLQKETTDSVLNFNEGLFTKQRAGLREPPCDGEAPGGQRLKVLVPLCLSKCRDSGVTRSEDNWGHPSKGAATGGERGAHSQTGMETEGQEAQDAIQRGQASLSRHRIEDR